MLSACSQPETAGRDHGSPNANADHWTIVAGAKPDAPVAIVAARDGNGFLRASCSEGDPSIALVAETKMPDAPVSRDLALGFDGAEPDDALWRWQRWGFETTSRQSDFQGTLTALGQHREAETVVWEAGSQSLRLHFSLAGAAEALDTAFKDCPPLPHFYGARPATSQQWGTLPVVTGRFVTVVGVLRPGGEPWIEVLCGGSGTLGILVRPKRPFSSPAEPSKAVLEFPTAEAAQQNWSAGPIGFELWEDDDGFDAVLSRLRTEQRVVVATRSPGQAEVDREVFPLAAARGAIDLVVHDCRD